MKKSLLTIVILSAIFMVYCNVANAATVTFTKPSIQVNQDESILEKKKQEYQAKKEAQQKANEAKKQQFQNEINKTKADIEKSKQEAKANQEKKAAEAKAKQKQRQDAINSFKDSFKN